MENKSYSAIHIIDFFIKWWLRKFPFRKRSLPFETVDAISQNSRCHLKRSMPFLKLAEQTTALVNSSYAVGTLGRHFRAVLFIRWRSNPRARELSQLKQNEPILLVQKQNKNQLSSQHVELLYAVSSIIFSLDKVLVQIV